MSAESWPKAIREACRLWREHDWPMIERGEFVTVCNTAHNMSETVDELNELAADYFGVTKSQLCAHFGPQPANQARVICWWVLRAASKWSLDRIAQTYDRNRATIISGLRRHDAYCDHVAGHRQIAQNIRQHWEALNA